MYHGAAAAYIQELPVQVEDVTGLSRLRSASTRCIQLPRMRTSTEQRSFAFHAEQFAINFAGQQFVVGSVQREAMTYLFGRGQYQTPSDAAGTFCGRGAVYKCSALLTSLLTCGFLEISCPASALIVACGAGPYDTDVGFMLALFEIIDTFNTVFKCEQPYLPKIFSKMFYFWTLLRLLCN